MIITHSCSERKMFLSSPRVSHSNRVIGFFISNDDFEKDHAMHGEAGTGPNPLHPSHIPPLERRAELCRILALGLVRLRMRENAQRSDADGEFPLHNPADQSGHATSRKETT